MKAAGGDKDKAVGCRRPSTSPPAPAPSLRTLRRRPALRSTRMSPGQALPGGRARLCRSVFASSASPDPLFSANISSTGSGKRGTVETWRFHGLRALPFSSSSASFLRGIHAGDTRFRRVRAAACLTAGLHTGLAAWGQLSWCAWAVWGTPSMAPPRQWGGDLYPPRAVGHGNGPGRKPRETQIGRSAQCYGREYPKSVHSWQHELQLQPA